MDTMEDETDAGFKALKERMQRREDMRLKEMQKRRQEKEENIVDTERVSYFQDAFNEQVQEVEDRLEELSSGQVNKALLSKYFHEISNDLANLEQFLAASTFYVRNYDVRKSAETMQALERRSKELQDQLIPKKKFTLREFASKKKEVVREKMEDAVDSVAVQKKVLEYMSPSIGYSHRIREVLSLTQGEVCKESVELTDLEDCTVKVMGTPSTLHLVSLKKCKILCGPVATSIFVDSCVDCTLVVACQQLRVHNTTHCDLYLHVTSRAIIEDCNNLRFAPYNWTYDDLDKHFEVAGLDPGTNNWTLVEDFNWIMSDRPSPNWTVIKDSERVDVT